MSRKEISRLLDHVEPQGVRLTRTTKGVLLRMPDDSTAMIHFTGSDHREPKNVRAALKRAGVTWPTDGGNDLRKDVTEIQPSARTLARVLPVLDKWEHRYITAAQLMRAYAAAHPGEPALTQLTCQRVLFHSGWTATGKTTARKWLRPVELEPDTLSDALDASVTPEDADHIGEPLDAAKEAPSPVLEPAVAESVQDTPSESAPVVTPLREFIDTADSWVVENLPPYMTIVQAFDLLRSFGLEGEIRVWRGR